MSSPQTKNAQTVGRHGKIIKHLFAGTAVKIRTYANFKIIAAQLYPNFTSRSTFVRLRAQFEHSASFLAFGIRGAKTVRVYHAVFRSRQNNGLLSAEKQF